MNELVTLIGELLPNIREEKVAGKHFLVAPAILAVPGILNGEMVELAELSRAAISGNGVPVTIGHPADAAGLPISANHPTVANIGRVYNLSAVDRLRGEAWIDVDLANLTAEGQEILRRIRAGELIENSPGWWRDAEASTQPGISAYARNIVLDHYAILLDKQGACSVNDGCGIPRVNSKEGCGCQTAAPIDNEEKNPPGKDMPLGERILNRVNQLWEHLMKNNSNARDELVERLAAVESIGLDAEKLSGLDDEVLAAFDRASTVPAAVESVEETTTETTVEVDTDDNGELETLRRKYDELQAQVERLTTNAANEAKAQRDERISALVANASVPFSADELEGFNDEQLETLAAKFRPGRFNGRPVPGASLTADSGELIELPMPAVNRPQA